MRRSDLDVVEREEGLATEADADKRLKFPYSPAQNSRWTMIPLKMISTSSDSANAVGKRGEAKKPLRPAGYSGVRRDAE
jgi:hypothetical protein